MKKSFFLLLSLFAIAWVIASCNKDQALVTPTAAPVRQQVNAYENIGVSHNEALAYYRSNVDIADPLPHIDNLVLQYVESLGYNRRALQAVLNDPATAAVVNSSNPTATLKQQLRQADQPLMATYVERMETVLNRATDPTTVRTQIEAVEQEVQQNASLTRDQQSQLLAGAAVAKHSAEYWYAQERMGTENPWNEVRDATGALAKPWWGYVMADVSGAIKGYESGGWPGAILEGAVATIKYALS